MSERGYDRVRSWARRAKIPGAKILAMHKLFIPVHWGGNHWVLAVVHGQRRTVQVFDSFNSHRTNTTILKVIKDYITHELGKSYEESEWTFESGVSAQQTNGYDCGVYTCLNGLAVMYADEPEPYVPQNRLNIARQMIQAVLCGDGFTDEFDLDLWWDELKIKDLK